MPAEMRPPSASRRIREQSAAGPSAAAPSVLYSPSLGRFSVGGVEFGRDEYDVALQSPQLLNRPNQPQTPAGDWQSVDATQYSQYLQSIGEGRGFLGNVGMGFRDVGEGVVGGVGRGLQMLGAEGAGQALVDVGEFLGPTAADEARDAAIRERQGLLGQIGTAAARSIPTLGLAIAGGVGGGALAAGGLRAAAAGGAAVRAGQLTGVSATIFPMEVQSSYTAAQQGGYDVEDPEVQSDIWATAATKTLAQTLPEAFLAGAFSRAFGNAVRDASRRTILNTAGPIVGVGSAEAAAETFATLADRVMFDPELRAEFNERDWAALAPLIVDKYGEEGLVAAGAGFLLGGGFRAAVMPFEGGRAPATDETPPGEAPPPQRDLTGTGETDVLQGGEVAGPPSAEQYAEQQAQLDALGIPEVQPEALPTMEAGLRLPDQPILDPLGPRVGELNAEEQDLANRWAARTQPPLELGREARTDLGPLALPAPASGGTIIPQVPLPLGTPLLPTLQAAPQFRTDTLLPLLPQQRAEPGQVEMFTPDEMGVGPATQARLTGQQLAGARRPLTRDTDFLPPVFVPDPQLNLPLSRPVQPGEGPATGTPMAEQLNRLLQQVRAQAEAQKAQEAEAATRAAQEAEQRAQREDQLLRSLEEQQQLEEDTNILGEELVGGNFAILGQAARAEWDAAVAALDPAVRAELTSLGPGDLPTTLAGNQAQAELARLGTELRRRTSNKLRRQAAEPPTVIPTETPATGVQVSGVDEAIANGIGTITVTDNGKPVPFKNFALSVDGNRAEVGMVERPLRARRGIGREAYVALGEALAARGITLQSSETLQGPGRKLWERLTMEGRARRNQSTKRFEFVAGEPDTTPPAGGGRTTPQQGAAKRRERRKKAAADLKSKGEPDAVQEQGPAEGAVRQEPETSEGVPVEDTQGQEAARARVEETQAEEAVTPTSPPEPAPEPAITRGDRAPRDMPPNTAWDQYVAPFLPVEFGARNLGALQKKWSDAVKAGRGNYDAARRILADSPTYNVLEAQELYNTSADPTVRDDALSVMLEVAFAGESTGNPSAALGKKTPARFAQDFLNELSWARADRETLLEFATLDSIAEERTAEKPTAQMRALNELLEATGVLNTAENVDGDTTSNPAAELTEEIVEYNKNPHTPEGWEQNRLRERVRNFTAYARENPEAWGSLVEGTTPLYQYLKSGYVNLRAGRITPDANATDPRTQARVTEGGSTEAGGALTGGFAPRTGAVRGGYQGKYSRVDYNDISNALDANGKPLTGPMPVGKQKMVIKTFLKRLRNAPRVYDFKDQADLRRKNPELYRRAAAARPEGDFDTTNAAGYSFGDGEVIVFTDRIANDTHLKFVLAHETFGHYGLRGVLPAAQFDSLMEGLYDTTPSIQRSVDAAMMANPELGKAEAVEEYLSDFAAALDSSIVLRVWKAIKNALNRLGVTFGDDSVRYLLDQSRRYARSPLQGFPMDLNGVAQRAYDVETGAAAPGRYSSTGDFFKDQRSLDEYARMGLPVPRSFQEGLDAMGGQWKNFGDGWRGFKSTFLSLNNFDSRTNPGLKRLHDVLQEAVTIAMSVRNTLNETMRPALNRGVLGFGGMSNTEYDQANNLLHHARIRAIMRLRDDPVTSREPLVVFDEAEGQFKRTDEVKRLDDLHRLKFEDARDGFKYVFTNTDADGNVVSTETIRVPGIDGLTKGSRVWLAYEAARKAYIDTELRLLTAQLSAGRVRESTALKEIGSVVPDGTLTTSERALMRIAIRRYQELYEAGSSTNAEGAIVYLDQSMQTAKEFAKAFNMAVIANEDAATDTEAQARNNAVKQFFDQAVADDVVAQIEAFKRRANFADDRFVVQNKIIGLHTQAMQENGASDFARNSIVGQYSPIVRTGDFEMRLVAKDARTGRVVSLDGGYKDGLLYSQFDSRAEALVFAKTVRSAFGTKSYTVKARNNDGQMVDTEVVFEPVVDRVLVEAANPLGVNLNEFVAGLNFFDINLPPAKREEVIVAMTAQDAAARRRLQAGLNPGDARDAISGIAQHIDGRASTIAKVQTRPHIDELMNLRLRESNALWSGDAERVEELRARYEAAAADPNARPKTVEVAKREYEEALMMYNNTRPEEGDSRKNEALNKAARTLSFLDKNASVNESDFEGSGLISAWRSYTSLIQLGGSIATGLLNPISVYTNGVPYLASYNAKTAFGGGFGAGRALTEVQRAFAQVGIPGMKNLQGMNTAEFWDGPGGVTTDPALQKKYGVTKREAQMIAREIREGRMIPAQSNALVGTSRGRTARGAVGKGIDLWMAPFNLTEQASRRAFGLASFRLEYARQMQAVDPTLEPTSPEFAVAEQAAYDRAVEFAGKAMDTALGDYSVLNRPAFFRSGIASMLYMYKVFPTTSIQMFNNLSFNGKMGMLAALWFLGGIAAFPFAEDLEDLTDTLMQKAGVGEGSVRAWAAQRLNEISPGLTPAILKGVMGNILPGDIAGRVSLSVIPGTEILLAGANTTRALEEIAGPMPSALLGTMQFASDLVRAPFSTTVTMERVFREAPVTGMRMAADAYAYAQSGGIVDRRGYIVASDVTTGELVMRLMGFYPRRAAETFGNVRVIQRMANYRREAATAYRQEWVSARIRNDRDRMREIERAVRDWNQYHRGGPLVIQNFREGSIRAYREAIRPATERGLRSVPQASRDQLTAIADALTF